MSDVIDVDLIYKDTLSLSVSDNENVTVSFDELDVTFGAVENWNGSETLVFTVQDITGETASDTLNIFVTPVNDAPVFVELADTVTTEEEIPLTITLTAEDPEEDDINYTASGNENVTVSVTDDQLTMTPALNYFGPVDITVTSSDGFKDSSAIFLLAVDPVQDAPVAVDDAYDNVAEGGTLIVSELEGVLINDTDVDGDNLTAVLDSMVNVSNLSLIHI